jgi:site-specific DNA-methyltransferase (adenine-specific)/modification methylase
MREETIGDARLILGDCREVLQGIEYVDALVTDPPYGINFAGQPTKWQRLAGKQPEAWDTATPDDLVAKALQASRYAIVWGGNYFALPPAKGWLSWWKPDAPPSMGHFELAWTNLDTPTRQICWSIGATNQERVGHPTQKPLEVMRWCIERIPFPNRLILDPFMGSGTTGVACVKLGRSFVGIEREPKYFDIACRRIEKAYAQPDLFVPRPESKPQQLTMDAI